jgi:hypothetical protein
MRAIAASESRKTLKVLNVSFTTPAPASLGDVVGNCLGLEVLKVAGITSIVRLSNVFHAASCMLKDLQDGRGPRKDLRKGSHHLTIPPPTLLPNVPQTPPLHLNQITSPFQNPSQHP